MSVRLSEGGYLGRPPGEFALTFAQQYVGNFDPIRWLLTSDANERHHAPGIMGSVFVGTYILGALGLYLSLRKAAVSTWSRYLVFGLLASAIPASLTLDPFHVHRLIALPIFLIALAISGQAWLLAERRGSRLPRVVFISLAVLTLTQAAWFHLRYDEAARQRGHWFDDAYPGLLRQALATGAEPIYLIDGIVPGYIHAYWYATTWGIPTERFVHLPRDTRASPGAIVLSSETDCTPCEELAARGFYKLYRAL